MQLAKRHKAPFMKIAGMKCQWPGCGEEYTGSVHSKYCLKHRGIKIKKPAILDDSGLIRYECKIGEEGPRTWQCECCSAPYNVVLIKSQKMYPRFCEVHRNKFKRELYLKTHPL